MTENVENLVLEHLRALREGQARIEHKIDGLTLRVGSLEGQVALLHKSVAFIHDDIAGLNQRFDHLIVRVERIERRLDLADAGD